MFNKSENPKYKEASLAVFSMFRVFLNAIENVNNVGGNCAKYAISEVAKYSYNYSYEI
jgi:hypothetical protein